MIKKMFLILVFILLFFQGAYCLEKPINKAINDATWVEVSLDTGTDAKDYAIQARGNNVILISDSIESGEADIYWTIKAGSGIALSEIIAFRGGVLFVAKVIDGSGLDVVEVIRIKYRSDLL